MLLILNKTNLRGCTNRNSFVITSMTIIHFVSITFTRSSYIPIKLSSEETEILTVGAYLYAKSIQYWMYTILMTTRMAKNTFVVVLCDVNHPIIRVPSSKANWLCVACCVHSVSATANHQSKGDQSTFQMPHNYICLINFFAKNTSFCIYNLQSL